MLFAYIQHDYWKLPKKLENFDSSRWARKHFWPRLDKYMEEMESGMPNKKIIENTKSSRKTEPLQKPLKILLIFIIVIIFFIIF